MVLQGLILQQMVIPHTRLDTGEEWLNQAVSPNIPGYLQEAPEYITSVFLNATHPRDIAYEDIGPGSLCWLLP